MGTLKYYDSTSGTWKRANAGSQGPQGPAGAGDVVGPASSTDNAIVRFDLATGKLVQNSVVTVSDAGVVSATGLTATSTGAANVIDVQGDTYPAGRITRTTTLTNSARTALSLRAKTSNDMVDGMGVDFDFQIQDNAGVDNVIGIVRASRKGADNTGTVSLVPFAAGSEFQQLVASSTDVTLGAAGTGLTSVTTNGATQTLTNKRISQRVSSAASASSITPDISSYDQYHLTALAANLTVNAPTGTPLSGDKLLLRIKDNGTSRTLTWNAIYRAIGVTLPTATTISKITYVGCVYNATDTKWDVIAVTQEA